MPLPSREILKFIMAELKFPYYSAELHTFSARISIERNDKNGADVLLNEKLKDSLSSHFENKSVATAIFIKQVEDFTVLIQCFLALSHPTTCEKLSRHIVRWLKAVKVRKTSSLSISEWSDLEACRRFRMQDPNAIVVVDNFDQNKIGRAHV